MRQFDAISLTKAVLWEEAKGKLRAIVAAEGAAFTVYEQKTGKPVDGQLEEVRAAVEAFIKDFEDNGLME